MDLVEVGLKLLQHASKTDTLERILETVASAIREASAYIEKLDDDELIYRADEEFEVLEAALGTAFVVCQAHMNGVISRVERMGTRVSIALVDGGRTSLLRLLPPGVGGLPRAEAVWHLANYFKHVDQWTPSWQGLDTQAQRTADAVVSLGLVPRSSGNLRTGAEALGLTLYTEMDVLVGIVDEWTAAVDEHVRARLGRPRT